MSDSGPQPTRTRPCKLQFNVIERSGLRSVRFHRRDPSLENVRRGDINEHRSDVCRLGFGSHRVIKQLLYRLSRRLAQFPDAAVTRQPAGIARKLSQPRMIGMLIFTQARRQHDAWTHTADDARQFNCVGSANFKVCVSVQFDKLNRCTKKCGGFSRLGNPLLGCAEGCGFTARTNDKVRRAAGMGFFCNDAAASELDIVGMRAKGQQWREFRMEFR